MTRSRHLIVRGSVIPRSRGDFASGPTSRTGSSTRSTARASSRRRASSTSTTTASSTSSRATPGTRHPTGSPITCATWSAVGTYYNDFATLPLDVNGDGHTDFVTCSYFGKNVGWVENPGKAGAPWTYHEVDVPGNIEAAWMVDLSGDGVPDVLPNTVNVVVWYEVVKKGDGKGFELKKHDFGTAGGRARRRLGRRQRRRPHRPAHAQGLVRGPGRSRPRLVGLAP